MVAVGPRHGGRPSRDVVIRLRAVRSRPRHHRDRTTGREPRTGGPPVSQGWDGVPSGRGWDGASPTPPPPPGRRHSPPRPGDDPDGLAAAPPAPGTYGDSRVPA